MKVLIAGWFSFPEMGATAGDLMTRDLAAAWLDGAGVAYDVALAAPFSGGIDWRAVSPEDYDQVIFVCGPFGNGPPITEFLPRFAHCQLIGLNLSMLQPLDQWNPFALLLERDSSRVSRPDLAFLSSSEQVPVVGVVLVHPQAEYGQRAMHEFANKKIAELLGQRHVAPITIDTRLDVSKSGFNSPQQVESVIAKVDAVVTTRLHGMVLAIKNGIPALAIDPIAGGAKLTRQATEIGWPVSFRADELDDDALMAALDYCLGEQATIAATECAARARAALAGTAEQFTSFVTGDG